MSHQLILVPTAIEFETVQTRMSAHVDRATVRFALCGFGPITAAARTAHLIATDRPQRVILVGIAGTYEGRIPVGSACCFERVACYGVGAGTGESHRSASQMGWAQLGDSKSLDAAGESSQNADTVCLGVDFGSGCVGDSIRLSAELIPNRRGTIITCCAASADERDVSQRLSIFPNALAEDMEGFGVALACALAGVPCDIVRGISNRAGDRDKSNWRIAEALAAAAGLTIELCTAIDD